MAATRRVRSQVLVGFDVTPGDQDTFDAFVARRRAHEPLQYIEGSIPFATVELHVDDRVLVPRPETEFLFSQVVAMVDGPGVIVDLCTGSGNLALGLQAAFRDARVYAVDLSSDAVDVARGNAEHNDLNIQFFVGDLFEPLPHELRGAVDLIVANPPYLAERELADLPPDVRFEPEMALVAGPVGDEVLTRIAAQADAWLAPGGVIACEISEFHGSRAAEIFSRYGGAIGQDLSGRDRYVFGSRGME